MGNFGNHSHGFIRIVLDDCQYLPKLYLRHPIQELCKERKTVIRVFI